MNSKFQNSCELFSFSHEKKKIEKKEICFSGENWYIEIIKNKKDVGNQMLRENIIEFLNSTMKGKYVVPPEDYRSINAKLPMWFEPDYSVENDPRLKTFLEYQSPSTSGYSVFFKVFGFAVVGTIMQKYGDIVPSREQMRELLRISGYTAKEMDEYVNSNTESYSIDIVPARSHIPLTFLLARLFINALKDKSEWSGIKNGKKKANYNSQQTTNDSLEKLNAAVKYLQENEILTFDDDTNYNEVYCKFVKDHVKPMMESTLYYKEHLLLEDTMLQSTKALAKELDKRIDRYERTGQITQANNKKNAMKFPAGNPIVQVQKQQTDISETLQNGILPMAGHLPPASSDIINYSHDPCFDEYDRVNQEYDCFCSITEEIYKRSAEAANRKHTECLLERREYIKKEDIGDVAVGFFKAILEHKDDFYKMNMGVAVFSEFIEQCELPLPRSRDVPDLCLSDEIEWNYIDAESNGNLAQTVIKIDDLAIFGNLEETGMENAELLSATISRLAGRPFEAPLYIRKSIIESLHAAGLSKRKARDCAIIVATLESAELAAGADYQTMPRYPEEIEEKITDERNLNDIAQLNKRIESEVEARKRAEAETKQLRKENKANRHDISTMQKEISRLRKQLHESKVANSNIKSDAIAKVTTDKNDVAENTDVSFPYELKVKAVLYGGFEVFHSELLQLIPDLKIVEVSNHVDITPVRNADIVFLQTNKTNHSKYWSVRDACSINDIPYFHLNNANAKLCAIEMVQEIKKIQKSA